MAELTPNEEGKFSVTIIVPRRPGYTGYWALGRFFPEGRTEAAVTQEELDDLRQQPTISVAPAGLVEHDGENRVVLTDEETALLAAYRDAAARGARLEPVTPEEFELLQVTRNVTGDTKQPEPGQGWSEPKAPPPPEEAGPPPTSNQAPQAPPPTESNTRRRR